MKILIALILAIALKAQTLTPSLSSSSTYSSSTITLNLSFADSAPPSDISALQWTIKLPAGFSMGTPVLGSGAVGKTIACAAKTGICIMPAPANSPPLVNGIVAAIPLTVAATGSFSVRVSGAIASTLLGGNVPITFQGGLARVVLPVRIRKRPRRSFYFGLTGPDVGRVVCGFDRGEF